MIEAVRVQLGLDKTTAYSVFSVAQRIFHRDLGISIFSFRPISTDLAAYFPTTLRLVGLSLVWVIVISIPVGLKCALSQNGIFDHITRGVTILGICLPTFWLGFLLLLAFCGKAPDFYSGSVSRNPWADTPILRSGRSDHLLFLYVFFAHLFFQSLGRDYVAYARARGLSSKRILLRHVMRNALPPLITLFCQYLGYLIAGSAVVENVFFHFPVSGHI